MLDAIATPRIQTHAGGAETVHQQPNESAPLIKGTYVSWDEVERADAHVMGYEKVCQHPNEVGTLGTDDELVIDCNNILFGDFDAAVRVAIEAIQNGATVGIHTYNPDYLPLSPLIAMPGLTVAKTHRELRAAVVV